MCNFSISTLRSQTSAARQTRSRIFVTTLQMTMDLRSVAPSAYQLALRRAAMTRAYFRRLSSSVTSVRKSGAVCYATWVAAPRTTHIGWPRWRSSDAGRRLDVIELPASAADGLKVRLTRFAGRVSDQLKRHGAPANTSPATQRRPSPIPRTTEEAGFHHGGRTTFRR